MRRAIPAAAALAIGLAGCKKAPVDEPLDAPSAAPSQPAPLPVDYTLPSELAEGTETVLGLVLPRGFAVVRTFEGETHARGPASPEQTANFLRRRLQASFVEVGPSSTIFQSARVKGGNGTPLRVVVGDRSGITEIVVHDLTPAKVDPSLSEEERWRRSGLKPNGELIDPQKTF